MNVKAESRRWLGACSFAMVAMAAVVVVGCDGEGPKGNLEQIEQMFSEYREAFPEVPSISAKRLEEMLEEPTTLLVDVREPAEREISWIPGSIPVEDFKSNLERYRGASIVAYCTIGDRSGRFARELRENEGLEAANLAGGILMWAHAGGALVDADGPTTRVHTYGGKWSLLPEGYEALW